MDPDCDDLRSYLGPIWDDWSRYEIETWKRYLALTTTLPCNWKVVMDNFNESYHVATVHKPTGHRRAKANAPGGHKSGEYQI